MTNTKDFGEYIGGAKKELWKGRGLAICDLDEMNAEERKKYVKKDNIWVKPDYKKMIADGMDIVVVWAVKKIRDAIPSNPYFSSSFSPETHSRYINGYINFVSDIRDMAMELKTRNDLLRIKDGFLYGNGYIDNEKSSSYRKYPSEKCYGNMTNKLFQALSMDEYKISVYQMEVRRKQFGMDVKEKLPTGYSILQYDGKKMKFESMIPGTWYVIRNNCYVMAENLPTREDAVKKAQELGTVKKRNTKKQFIPNQLQNIIRSGLTDVRAGRNISGQDFIDTFHIRGGEFGNWMSELDAQSSMNMAYEAFFDFADALGIKLSDASFGGHLSIAFGARGSGNMIAHYEPAREVINITKLRGAGSLGHELFHALDDICGKKLGLNGMMSRSENCSAAMKEVIDCMCYKPASLDEISREKERNVSAARESFIRKIHVFLPDKDLSDSQRTKRDSLIELSLQPYSDLDHHTAPSFLNDLYILRKDVFGHIIKKNDRKIILYAWISYQTSLSFTGENLKVHTEYYQSSMAMDKYSKKEPFGYWGSVTEMFARAGSCFLVDEIAKKGGVNDYLTGHSESAMVQVVDVKGKTIMIKAYPEGEERIRINSAIRKLIEYLKDEGILEQR